MKHTDTSDKATRGFERFSRLLACPVCVAPLEPQAMGLMCGRCGSVYPIRDGVPIFTPDPQNVITVPFDGEGHPIPPEFIKKLASVDGYSLNIGAGATNVSIPQSIQLECYIFKNTDVVGDAHRLPFIDEAFDAVAAFSVFEHLCDPPAAVAEAFRVLKPGGEVIIHTAFLQPLHESPLHYYNATEHGLLRWFSDFDIESCRVSDNFQPAHTIAWLSNDLILYLEEAFGPEWGRRLAMTNLDQWRQLWIDKSKRCNDPLWDILSKLPQQTQKRLCARFELTAKKPIGASQTTRTHSLRAIGRGDRRGDQDEIRHLKWRIAWHEEQTDMNMLARDAQIRGLQADLDMIKSSTTWRAG